MIRSNPRPNFRRKAFWTESSPVAVAAVALLAILGTACATPAPPPGVAAPAEYRVGPPDQLFITVLPEPVIERGVVVRPDGMISFDLIGDVQAQGQTVQQIAREIEKRIRRFKRDARATVSVTMSQTQQVTIFGEVNNPGVIQLTNETRAAEAIGQMGGTSFLAWRSRVRLIRTDGQATKVHRINLAAIQGGDLSTNMLVQGGDIIVVPKTPLGVVGTMIQQLVFPFNTLIGPSMTAANLITR